MWCLLVAALLGVGLPGCGGGSGPGGASPPSRNFAIAGSVSGLAAGRTLTLLNNGSDRLALAANGSFAFGILVLDGGAYAVSVAEQPQGQACRVERSQGSALAPVNDVVVVCRDVPAVTYRVGGTVSGLAGNGSVLGLRNNRLDFLDIFVNGTFRFNSPLAAGETYSVVVQRLPAGQLCTVSQGVGSATADVNDVAVVCSASSIAPPGGVQSMAGTWLNGVCATAAGGRSTRILLSVTRQSDQGVAVSESTANFSNSRCEGSFTPGAFAPAAGVTVRRTESTATTSASWSHWQAASGALYSALWHWRRNELCLRSGPIGDASDPELSLPSAAAVEVFFAPVPADSPGCYVRH